MRQCRSYNRPGFKWGDKGKCYTYTPNDPKSRQQARRKAEEQGRAIEAGREREQKG